MNWFYIPVGILFLIIGFIFLTSPDFAKKLIKVIMDRELFFFIGVTEIGLGLGTLYFRQNTNLKLFVYLIGLILFIDGIFYLTSPKRLKETYKWFLESEEKSIRAYGIVMILISAGFLFAGVL